MQAIMYWLHLIGITFWVGGIFVNTLVLMPSIGAISPGERGKLMGAFVKRFGPMAWGAIGLIVVTGLILTSSRPGFSTLFSFNTSYGNILLTKIILVVVMILNGAYLGFVVGPKIASFGPPTGDPPPTGPGEGAGPPGPPPALIKLQGQMNILNWVQVVLGLVVLFLTGLL